VISASHNPHDDNGIKFFSAEGTKLPDATEEAIEAQIDKPMRRSNRGISARRDASRTPRTLHRVLQEHDPVATGLHRLRVVVDCAHGATYHIAPAVLEELGADVTAIGVEPNGLNINDGVGATAPAALVARSGKHGPISASRSTVTATG
jgi:phosphoglucosamine mutase